MRIVKTVAIAALALATSGVLASSANAQWRGHHGGYGYHHHRGGGGAAIGGFVAGALLGGALASQPRYYGPGPGYAYGPGYGGSEVQYCLSRFKSYDPRSGTYLGYDGYRHPCP